MFLLPLGALLAVPNRMYIFLNYFLGADWLLIHYLVALQLLLQATNLSKHRRGNYKEAKHV